MPGDMIVFGQDGIIREANHFLAEQQRQEELHEALAALHATQECAKCGSPLTSSMAVDHKATCEHCSQIALYCLQHKRLPALSEVLYNGEVF